MRSGRCPPHDDDNDARRICPTPLVDLELHQRVIMRIPRHTDVSMTLGIYVNPCADGDARSAARAGGALRCAGQISSSLLYLPYFAAVLPAAEAPTKSVRASGLREYQSG